MSRFSSTSEDDETKIPKVQIVTGIIVLVVIVALVFSCVNQPDEKLKDNTNTIFNQSQTKPTTVASKSASSTTVVIKKYPFDETEQQRFYALGLTGELESGSPESYVSPRWEAILGGDQSNPVPIDELDKASNSDLGPESFRIARDTAIAVATGIMTGEGTSQWPDYFSNASQQEDCKDFTALHAGAIAIPYPGETKWITTRVIWEATCFDSEQNSYVADDGSVTVFFSIDNGALTPRDARELPL